MDGWVDEWVAGGVKERREKAREGGEGKKREGTIALSLGQHRNLLIGTEAI